MRKYVRVSLLLLLAIAMIVGVSACSGEAKPSKTDATTKDVNNERESFPPAYVPHNHVEFNNFNEAQKLYDTPSTIIWCTTTWGNPSAPLVTVPVAGKLTSSSVSFLPQNKIVWDEHGNVLVENFSNDGMYHGSPPPYRYGFTPGHQYVDFFNMPAFCTTAMTEFQRQQTKIALEIDPAAEQATTKAEAVLRAGTNPSTGKISSSASAEAQKILTEAKLGG